MHDLLAQPETDPAALYRARDGIYAADLLVVAIVELDLFTVLAATPCSFSTLCASLQLAPRPADVLITYLAALGLIDRDGDTLRITATAREHLVRGSPWYLGPYYASYRKRPGVVELLGVLRSGKPANWSSNADGSAWLRSMEDPAFAAQFTAAMDCRGLYLGRALGDALQGFFAPRGENTRRILDVAGGSGVYAAVLVSALPGATAVVLERPPVDRVCAESIAARGLGHRVQVLAGDMFTTPWPGDCDLHLLSNVIHDWDAPTAQQLIARSAASLLPGGWLVVHDAHLNATKTGPLPVAAYSVLLMHACEGRCYSHAEIAGWMRDAGLADTHHLTTAADRSVVVGRRPK